MHDITKQQELEKMKLDFVSMAAHELRTPLTSIRGYLSFFMDENQEKLDEKQTMLLGRMANAAEQLSLLIENLLSVTRIERGEFNLNRKSTNWVLLVGQAVDDFINRADEKGVSLSFTNPPQPIPAILIDDLRATEVLENLLANAIAHTQASGSISVWIEERENEVVTHVKDTGEGIPKEALPQLFTKFFRVSGLLGKGSKGTGLGLYIAKSIMDAHKGKIWVDSEIGKGSTFSFAFPIQE